jgi:hypothetical protein
MTIKWLVWGGGEFIEAVLTLNNKGSEARKRVAC